MRQPQACGQARIKARVKAIRLWGGTALSTEVRGGCGISEVDLGLKTWVYVHNLLHDTRAGRWGGRRYFVGSRHRRGVVDLHPSFPRAASHAAFEYNTVWKEVVRSLDGIAAIAESHTLTPINVQHPGEEGIDFGRDREDGRGKL